MRICGQKSSLEGNGKLNQCHKIGTLSFWPQPESTFGLSIWLFARSIGKDSPRLAAWHRAALVTQLQGNLHLFISTQLLQLLVKSATFWWIGTSYFSMLLTLELFVTVLCLLCLLLLTFPSVGKTWYLPIYTSFRSICLIGWLCDVVRCPFDTVQSAIQPGMLASCYGLRSLWMFVKSKPLIDWSLAKVSLSR